MTEVRPTIDVLKELEKKKLLPLETARALQHARKIDDRATRVKLLIELNLSSLDVNLLRDARSGFATGLPDRHSAMSNRARCPVYEVRDHSAAGWRGAVVKPEDDDGAWLVYVEAHDRFHSVGPGVIATKASNGSLGPSSLDRKIRDVEHASRAATIARAELLEALIDALISSTQSTELTRVATPSRFTETHLSVQVNETVIPEWNPADAHEQLSDLIVRLKFTYGDPEIQDELIRTCLPFLQPDRSMWDYQYRDELTVQVLVSRAVLMQLLATERPLLPVKDRPAPVPSTLHYTAKGSLTKAFVSGDAVRAVCGQWWVPVGDGQTHSDLPICPECEQESPFAQAVHDLILKTSGTTE